MNINQLKESKYLKKEDCGNGVLVTIRGIVHENVAKEGAEPEMKWILYFQESDKGMVLNSTNGQLLASFLKSEETDDWIGHKVVLYHDPNVSFGGKLIGGIRVRAPRPQAAAKPSNGPNLAPRQTASAPAGRVVETEPAPAEDSDVPF